MLDGKRNGTYLEVGAQQPKDNNNTYLLHRFFDWNGVSLELDPAFSQVWQSCRGQTKLFIGDALAIDYRRTVPQWFGEQTTRIDYLQLDIDPSQNTLKVLQRLPLDQYRFSVITFETDAYTQDHRARQESRTILQSYGYALAGPDVSVLYPPISDQPIPFEDWWVDPQAISQEKIDQLRSIRSVPLLPQELILRI